MQKGEANGLGVWRLKQNIKISDRSLQTFWKYIKDIFESHLDTRIQSIYTVKISNLLFVIILSYAKFAKEHIKMRIILKLIIRTCISEYETKIQQTLLIKKHNLQLNKQLYAKGSPCLLDVYKYFSTCTIPVAVYCVANSWFCNRIL